MDRQGSAVPEVLALPLDIKDPATLAAAHLMLTELARVTQPTYSSTHERAVELIENMKKDRSGVAVMYAMLDPGTHQVIAAADVVHRVVEGDKPYESYSYVNKIAVHPDLRLRGYGRKVLERVDREAQRRGDVRIRLYPLVPEMFEACGFISTDDARMVAPAGAVVGLLCE